MERLRRAVQPGAGAAALGLSALFYASNLQAQTSATGDASPAEIVAARELFRQGTADADAGRFADGLEKFKRVAAVKETAAVRFNLARCEEALGKTGAALADFELAEREGQDDLKAADVGKLAHDRADALRPRVPRLTLLPPSPPPEGMTVSLDGGKLASATLGAALPVDPGTHVVDATAPSSSPFHAELTLAAGESKRLSLSLEAATMAPRELPSTADGGSSQRTWGWVTLAAGGLFAIGSGVFLGLHDNAVSSVNADCPSGRCPASRQTEIEGMESTARNDETMSIVFIAASALAIGGGAVLVATAPSKGSTTPMAVTTGAPGAPVGLSLRVAF